MIPLLIELKPFPANGWALDIYESVHPAFSAIFSAATGAATLFAVDKIANLGGASWAPMLTGIGLFTFVAANTLALAQRNDRRLLGYSSIAQTGLILVVIGQRDALGAHYLLVAGGLLLGHSIAKAGLFWLSGLLQRHDVAAWADLRRNPLLVFAFASFISMLVGLPPFPGFYAKWALLHNLAGSAQYGVMALILVGALLEAGYLFRWFGYMMKRAPADARSTLPTGKVLIVVGTALAGWGGGFIWGWLSGQTNLLTHIALLFALGFLIFDWAPARLKNVIAMLGLLAYFYQSYPAYDPLQMIFGAIILLGGAVILLASFFEKGQRVGFYPAAMLMFAGLAMLIVAEKSFDFFAAWEILTIGSYFLILRGKYSEPHALSYILFSLGGAFAMIAGFALAGQGRLDFDIAALQSVPAELAVWVFALLAFGFLTKTAALGVHIWLPGAHAGNHR